MCMVCLMNLSSINAKHYKLHSKLYWMPTLRGNIVRLSQGQISNASVSCSPYSLEINISKTVTLLHFSKISLNYFLEIVKSPEQRGIPERSSPAKETPPALPLVQSVMHDVSLPVPFQLIRTSYGSKIYEAIQFINV